MRCSADSPKQCPEGRRPARAADFQTSRRFPERVRVWLLRSMTSAWRGSRGDYYYCCARTATPPSVADNLSICAGTSDSTATNNGDLPTSARPTATPTASRTTAIVTTGGAPDCNSNGVPDECDITTAACRTATRTSVPDSCDISTGASRLQRQRRPRRVRGDDGDRLQRQRRPRQCELISHVNCDVNAILEPVRSYQRLSTANPTAFSDVCELISASNCIRLQYLRLLRAHSVARLQLEQRHSTSASSPAPASAMEARTRRVRYLPAVRPIATPTAYSTCAS